MKVFFLSLLFGLSLFSCQPNGEGKSELKVYEISSSDFKQIINEKSLPAEPDLTSDKTILNRDYPIELALYNDGRWFYDLPNLDTGTGTWKYEEGKIKLFASRNLFDMYIDIIATKEHGDEMAIRFSDRFGPKVLQVEKINVIEDSSAL